MFDGKRLLITGGTGSFGRAVLDRFLDSDVAEIRVFSRDEKKQYDMARQYQGRPVSFYLGDVRDIESVRQAMHGVHFVFHAAALKQVPSCERFPMEAFKTNVLGAGNVLDAAQEAGVERLVFLSTDKAAYPESVMGLSKAMMEKLCLSRAAQGTQMCISGTRFGNVLCSRGSVVPVFLEQIQAGGPLTVTDPFMTRFIMTLEEAVDLTMYAFTNARSGDRFIRKAPACTIGTLAQAVNELFGGQSKVEVTGAREGDKQHEVLLTQEECALAEDLGDFYRIPASIKPSGSGVSMQSCSSQTAERLTVEQVKQKLLETAYIQRVLGK